MQVEYYTWSTKKKLPWIIDWPKAVKTEVICSDLCEWAQPLRNLRLCIQTMSYSPGVVNLHIKVTPICYIRILRRNGALRHCVTKTSAFVPNAGKTRTASVAALRVAALVLHLGTGYKKSTAVSVCSSWVVPCTIRLYWDASRCVK